MKYRLKQDSKAVMRGDSFTVPKGATIVKLDRKLSGEGVVLWAVESESLLAAITGDSHTPKYYFAFVDAKDVESIQ